MPRRAFSLAVFFILIWTTPDAQASNYIFGCPITIDDFDSGALPPANGPFEFTHVGLPSQSCAGGSRRVWINDVLTHSAGMIVLGGNDIAFRIQTEEHAPGNDVKDDADVVLDYVMAQPLDLTAGGLNDRFLIDVVSVSFMSVFVEFSAPGGSSASTILLQPGSNQILLSSILVDPTEITRIALYFNEHSTSGFGELTISRIRVTGNTNKYLFLDLPILVQQFPPFDLPGPLMNTYIPVEGGGFEDSIVGQLNLRAADRLETPGTDFPTELHSSSSAAVGGPLGTSAGYSAFEWGLGKADHGDGHFEFGLGFQESGQSYPGRLHMPAGPQTPNNDVFYLPFEIDVLDGAGAFKGRCMFRLRVAIPDGVAYDIRSALLHPPDPIWDPEFEFEIVDDGTSGKLSQAPGQPLFDISLEGDWFPNSNVTAAPLPRHDLLVLSAAPSVFGQRTELSLNRQLSHAAEIRLFDLSGRMVRRLRLPAGLGSVHWNGRDQRGQSVASGVYVAQLEAAGQVTSRKLTVIR